MPDQLDLLARLYRAPLAEFVVTRKALADELRAAGQKTEAQALLKRAKPRPAAWVANQLHYQEPTAVAAARAAAAAVAAAQAEGGRSVAGMQALLDERNRAIRALLELGQRIASQAGSPLSRAQERELQNTLQAWSAQPTAHALGQLERAIEPPSFDLLDAQSVLAARPPITSAAGAGDASAPLESATAELKAATPDEALAHETPAPPPAAESQAEAEARQRAVAAARRRAERAAARRAARDQVERARAETELWRERMQRADARRVGAQAQADALRAQLKLAEERLAAAARDLAEAQSRHARATLVEAEAEAAAQALADNEKA